MAKTENWQRRPRADKGFDEFAPTPDLPPLPSFTRRPAPAAMASSGPESTAIVKWFNSEKGFGFVEVEGSGDVFLHVSALTRLGVNAVGPGTTLKVRVGQGQKGPQVLEVTEVDDSTAGSAAPAPRAARPSYGAGSGSGFGSSTSGYGAGSYGQGNQGAADTYGGAAAPRRSFEQSAPSGPEQQGTVKWYNTAKGFGFIAPEDGGKDVFVHASALRRAGLVELAEGQRVTIQIAQGQKGPEATSIRTA